MYDYSNTHTHTPFTRSLFNQILHRAAGRIPEAVVQRLVEECYSIRHFKNAHKQSIEEFS